MKKIILAVTLLTLAFSFTTAQKTVPIKQVQVTAQTIASQPAGKPYVIDLTRNGTIYVVAAGINYSQLRVRTPTGELAGSDLVRRLGSTGSKLLLGTGSDIVQKLKRDTGGTSQPPGGGTSQIYDCSHAQVCTCIGFSDCLALYLDKLCKPDDVWLCDKTICACTKK